MADKPTYYDIRDTFWRRHFETALSWEDFLTDSERSYADQWRSIAESLPALPDPQRQLLEGLNRQLNVLVYVGVWCGDCVRQGPMFKRIADQIGDNVDLRYYDREGSAELQDELRVMGALRVPVVVFLSEDYHEICRFGDRGLTNYRAKLARDRGEATGPPQFPPPDAEMTAEQLDWADLFERALIMLQLAPPLRKRYED